MPGTYQTRAFGSTSVQFRLRPDDEQENDCFVDATDASALMCLSPRANAQEFAGTVECVCDESIRKPVPKKNSSAARTEPTSQVVYLVLGRERDVERGAGLGHDDLLLGEERDRLGDAQVRRDALAVLSEH